MSDIPPPQPFWFATAELSALLHAEIVRVNKLIEQHPELPNLFDAPEATVSQRKFCFALLAHREVMGIIYESFAGIYQQPPSFGEEQSNALRSTDSLVTSDAPDWTLEMSRVVDALPYHLFNALPEPLRVGRFNPDSESQAAAVNALGTVEQIQTLIEGVLDQQLGRLEKRWSVAVPTIPSEERSAVSIAHPGNKRKGRRRRDEQRTKRDRRIAEIDEISETPTEFLRLMDERKVRPQPTWSGWPGSWKEAYKDPRLRRLIHQDKSRALTRASRKK